MSKDNLKEKDVFAKRLMEFANSSAEYVMRDSEWTIKGFIDIFKNIYALSTDTKVISKVLKLHLFPQFLNFAESIWYRLEPAEYQNWYPDLTFIKDNDHGVKFAVDLKTTYRDENRPAFCNGFTLGSHGEYFVRRESKKNIQYPYNEYMGHFCFGIIYSRMRSIEKHVAGSYSLNDLLAIPSVASHFVFFAQEKWKIASDKSGSGNTANIGSIHRIDDILAGNGVFALAGEEIFDDYWANFGKMQVPCKNGEYKPLSSLDEYLAYKRLPASLKNSAHRRIGANP
ncbi:MAG: EcoRV family type II restriction endonuclease [Synergistaceae bacterium]|jgi:hypothetical protein|nr:EcoRV family type II restriction endonuclease [Synergistaceae bacterium]